eukprot:Tbor_TRINITY_DN4107_c0_g1::TRINITY_DN4107_c0_g1_i1::g.26561::m.26561
MRIIKGAVCCFRRGFTFVIHSVVHVVFYLTPQLIKMLFFNGPITAIEAMIGLESTCCLRGRSILYQTNMRVGVAMEAFGFRKHSILSKEGQTDEEYPDPLYNGHIGTMIAPFVRVARSSEEMGYIREIVTCDYDSQEFALDWLIPKSPAGSSECQQSPPKSVVLVVPGMGSTSENIYIQRFSSFACEKGHAVCIINSRGRGGVKLTTTNLSTAIFTEDLRFLDKIVFSSDELIKKFKVPEAPKVVVVGFSLGGSQLIQYLYEVREKTNFHAAVAVCAPWDSNESRFYLMNSAIGKVYNRRLARGLMKYMHYNKDVFLNSPEGQCESIKQILTNPRGIKLFSTVEDFDSKVLCPHLGLASIEDYFNIANAFTKLHKLEIPVLCFTASDDVLTGPEPHNRRWAQACSFNPLLLMISVPAGGHLGFLQDPVTELLGRPNYMESRVIEAIDSVRNFKYTKKRRDVPDVIHESHIRGKFVQVTS